MEYREMTGTLRVKKQRLEEDLIHLLGTFEKETGLRVENFYVLRSTTMGKDFREIEGVVAEIKI